MSLQRVQINNFRGGLNTRDGPFDLQPNESPDLLNVTISALVGQLKTREGKNQWEKSLQLPGEEVNFAKQAVIGSSKRFLMLSINGNIWMVNPAGEAKKLHAGTAGTIWDFEVFSDLVFKDWVYCSNGVDTPQKWDGEAAATVEWTVAKGALPNGGCLCVWENRMIISHVAATPQRIFFSEFGDPQAGNAEYGFLDVRGPEDDLDAVRDIAVLGARLFILKRRSVFMVTNPASFISRRIGGPGVWDRFQVQEMEDKLYFFNPQGIWSTAGVAVTMESGQINNYFPKELNKNQLEKARLIATKDTYPRLLLAIATGVNTSNDKLLELIPHINFRRIGGRRYLLLPAFMLHTIPTSTLATWNPTGSQELIIGTGQSGGLGPKSESFITTGQPIEGDTLEGRTELHLSNGGKWEKQFWSNNTVTVTPSEGATAAFGESPAAYIWTPRELNNSQVSLELDELTPPSQIAVWACCPAVAAKVKSGYAVRWRKTGASKGTITIEKWVAGVLTTLRTGVIGGTTRPHKLGIQVTEGKVQCWMEAEPGTGWVLFSREGEDLTFIKGFAGFEFLETEGGFKNFTTSEHVSNFHLYELFTGETDAGAKIEAHWQSAYMAVQEQEPKERIRRVDVQLTGDALVEVFTDFEATPRFTEKLPTLGQVEESGEPSGEGLAYRFARVRPETHGRYHSIRFSTDPEGKPFSINGAEMAVRGGKEH